MTYELSFSQTNLYLNETITISVSPLSSNQYWWLMAINGNKSNWRLIGGTNTISTSTLSYTLTSNSLLYEALNSGTTEVYAMVWTPSSNGSYTGESSNIIDLTLVNPPENPPPTNPPPIITTQNYDFGYTKTRIFSRINGKDNIF